MKLDWASKKKISCVVQYFFSLHSVSRWIQLLLPMYDGLCIFGMDKSTSSPRSGPSYSYPDSLTDHNAICYSSWDHISLSSFFLIYPVYHIYIYIYMCVCLSLHHFFYYKFWNTITLWIFCRRKCTFSPYILTFFHFNSYILFLPLLVPKPINAGHLSP